MRVNFGRRVWLVGEQNPYQTRPRPEYDLYPEPAGSAGARLAAVLGYGDDHDLYLASFERRNLLYGPDRWSAPVARGAALRLGAEAPEGDAFVLLGARVAAAFGAPYEPLWRSSAAMGQRLLLVVPHPSGLSRAWNDPTMAPRVRGAVTALRGGR